MVFFNLEILEKSPLDMLSVCSMSALAVHM